MKKCVSLVLGLVLVVGMLAGCATQKIADCFDEDVLSQNAQGVIELINNRDYDGICELFTDDVKAQITATQLGESLDPMLDFLGEFKKFEDVICVGQTDKKTKDDFASVVYITKYRDGSATFTISYNEDMQLIGLYMK